MRILFSLLDAGVGGGQTVALSVASRLVADGHSVGLLVPARGPGCEGFCYLGSEVHTIDLHSLRRVGSIVGAARALRDYDVLYSHTSIPGEILGDLAVRIARRRHVVHRHTPPRLSPNRWSRAIQAGLYRLLLRRRAIVSVAPHIAAAVVALGVTRANVRVIPNGVDADLLPPVPARNPGAPLKIGVLGRADPQKGFDIFAGAVQILRRKGVSADFVAGIATGGFPEHERVVVAHLQEAGVELTTPGSDGPGFLAGLDVVAMPSRWEGSPLTLFESLGLGKPVIASAIPGMSEVLAGEDAGLLVPSDDPEALATAMEVAIDDEDSRARWSKNALSVASRNTRRAAAERAVGVITEVCGLREWRSGPE